MQKEEQVSFLAEKIRQADAVLIGETLMRAPDIAAALKELRGDEN